MLKFFIKFIKVFTTFLIIYSCFIPSIVLADMHFIEKDGLFNFSLKSSGWFESNINDKLFFNISPLMSLIVENETQNVFLSICQLPINEFTNDIEKAYSIITEKINSDNTNIIFLKNDITRNDVSFKEITFKNKLDLSNTRIILIKNNNEKNEPLIAACFYFPKNSDFVNSNDDLNYFIKTFMFKTELAEPVTNNLINIEKDASCIGEYVSLYEVSNGIVGITNNKSKLPLFKSPLVRLGQILETNEGNVSFVLNDGTLGFVKNNSKLEFVNMAKLKLTFGEVIIDTFQNSSSILLYCGNFLKAELNKGIVIFNVSQIQNSNQILVKIIVLDQNVKLLFEESINSPYTNLILNKGESLEVIISEAGKVSSVKQQNNNEVLDYQTIDWVNKLITFKIVKTKNYLNKLKEINK